MALIRNYKEGSNISVLKAEYHRPYRDENGKRTDDFIVITYKDNDRNTKGHKIIKNPAYQYYIAKDGYVPSYNMLYIPKEHTKMIECKYTDLLKSIAENTNNLDFFYENMRAGNFAGNKALFNQTKIFMSDVNIEDHYRARFAREYKNEFTKPTKGFLDIEVDTRPINGDFPTNYDCPINAVTYIDENSSCCYTFLLRNESNKLIDDFENLLKNESTRNTLFLDLKNFVIENVGGLDKAQKFGVDKLTFNFSFFDEEIELLEQLFRVINSFKPDFALAWNMAFDIPYIIERIKILGYNPADIMSDKSYEVKYNEYFIDHIHSMNWELRGDYYTIAADTIYIDQLIQFASRRKGQSQFPDFKLDTAANIITKGAVRKLDYSNITSDLSWLPYKNYTIFVFYNIMDVIAQKCIEVSTNDIDYIYSSALQNDTRYSKVHRQTVYLANRVRKFFWEKGYITGNNASTGVKTPYPGALVGDPTHNSDYAKVKQHMQTLNLADNSDDFDFKSLYPSETRQNNLAPDNIIGKIQIKKKISKYENPFNKDKYDRGGQFMEDLITGNHLEFGRRWLHLGSIQDVLSDMEEFFSAREYFNGMDTHFYETGQVKPVVYATNITTPVAIISEHELMQPVVRIDKEECNKINIGLVASNGGKI